MKILRKKEKKKKKNPNEDSQKEGKKNPNEKDSLLNKKDFMCAFFKVCSKWLDKAAS